MIEREKVMRGLECCMRENNTNMCGDCPYHDSSETRFGCMRSAMRDALALLREQEPRVLTLEEIKLLPDESDVFLEEIDCIVVAATISRQGEKWGARTDSTFFYGIESTSYESDEYYNDDYGRWWRLWTSRPTEEQRKVVAWDD